MASPLHWYQLSLEGVIDFSTESPLETDERIRGKHRFYRLVEHFEAEDEPSRSQYSRPRLIRFTYEYALSEESRDNFLRAFFKAMALSIDGQEELDFEELRPIFLGFADYLLDNFFLPLKASTKKTPQPSPAYHSAVQQAQGGTQEFSGTPDRVSALRGACLTRDRHRCVVTRKFDQSEAISRFNKDGLDAQDDDGVTLLEDPEPFDYLEVAHILPHPLTKTQSSSQLDTCIEAALVTLNMLDSGVTHLIEGADIDRPRNAITLTHALHNHFGGFHIFFEPVPSQPPHTYQIRSFLPRYVLRDPVFPLIRTLYLTNTRTIDPPSPRLLAVHRAIAHILHLSEAGSYIDRLLQDVEERGIQADGSTELGRLLKLGLGGWLNSTVST